MNFIISANTDIGIVKDTNQDGLSVMVLNTPQGRMAFAVLCDGMGGLAQGEVASATLVTAFRNWATEELPGLFGKEITETEIQKQWFRIVRQQNSKIKAYGARQGVRLGTTAVAMLLTQTRYFVLNVGDSRAYMLTDTIRQITKDQTFVAREIAMGRMTPEEAACHPRRNALLQCVGASEEVYPDLFCGEVQTNAVYMLCSDGFRHEISTDEIYSFLRPDVLLDEKTMQRYTLQLIEMNKQRRERDNISAVVVRTF